MQGYEYPRKSNSVSKKHIAKAQKSTHKQSVCVCAREMRKLNDSVLLSLALVRSIGAAVNHIDDCDEVFNYWEPLHYLVYGAGMQTWEYAPEYALRTYGYLAPCAILGKALTFCGMDKLAVFFTLRMTMALLSAGLETLFVQAVQQKFGKYVLVV